MLKRQPWGSASGFRVTLRLGQLGFNPSVELLHRSLPLKLHLAQCRNNAALVLRIGYPALFGLGFRGLGFKVDMGFRPMGALKETVTTVSPLCPKGTTLVLRMFPSCSEHP